MPDVVLLAAGSVVVVVVVDGSVLGVVDAPLVGSVVEGADVVGEVVDVLLDPVVVLPFLPFDRLVVLVVVDVDEGEDGLTVGSVVWVWPIEPPIVPIWPPPIEPEPIEPVPAEPLPDGVVWAIDMAGMISAAAATGTRNRILLSCFYLPPTTQAAMGAFP